eukprot:TRINITY_DN743_c0_g1_i4.p1 TRINITY_DN743_c0_g1~~TRINITY_DN743_c0_g1_i4.p1  ORF type:complete len:1152 (-),score=276.77 TRINITY_DN743_c0_g1_i4:216-3671(-)
MTDWLAEIWRDGVDSIKSCVRGEGEEYVADPFRTVKAMHQSLGPNDAPSPFPRNKIRTAKYVALTFLPVTLFEQLHRVANLYFLVISILQQLPGVSPTGRYTTIGPLILVMTVTAVKEAYEDYKRHQSDHNVNNNQADIMKDRTIIQRPWKNVYVGDIIKLKSEQQIPADMVLLSSSDPTGICYIETANLDGEINLKLRQALTPIMGLQTDEGIFDLECTIECEHPNNNLHKFEGTLILRDGKHALDMKQFLPRGCVLRNTDFAYGLVVFTGPETKLMLNSTAAPLKRTQVERITNTQILRVLYFEIFICIIGMIGASIYNSYLDDDYWYLQNIDTDGEFVIKSFFTFLILFNGLIPISLYVTMEMVKVVQGTFINNDREMYYGPKNTPANARTTNLNEELGQVEYVFSDKTGTLTRNQMEFMRCSVRHKSYGDGKTSVSGENMFNSDDLLKDLTDPEQGPFVDEYLTHLAVCHTVIPETKAGQLKYQAASPDEGALVSAAAELGYRFVARSNETTTITVRGESREFRVYQILEFNSVRKRMSVICRTPEGKLVLYCKGADSIIYARLKKDTGYEDQTVKYLEEYASQGLRTLCIAKKELSEELYADWSRRYLDASTSLENRDEQVDALAEEIEKGMTLIGTTAIEDKLQEGVPDTIQTLLKAGIKVWVLTGDKQETAINIGYSCGLLTQAMNLVIINQKTLKDTKDFVNKQLEDVKGKGDNTIIENLALIIDGETLHFALEDDLKYDFLRFARLCQSVVCCRVTPRQKAMVVELVKDNLQPMPVTLSIGDGANDVPMIQSAHIGIGISGEEGMQAVFASDYSIAQFRFLKRLLLVHGRWSYIRTSKVIVYSFYKNMALQLSQFCFACVSAFSGQTMIESWTLSLYNVFFTSLPIIVLGALDRDVSEKRIAENPQLYKTGHSNYYFNTSVFWGWCLNGIGHSLVIFIFILFAYNESFPSQDGHPADIWMLGTTIYSCVVILVNLKLALEVASWTYIHHIIIWGTVSFWIFYLGIYGLFYPNFPVGAELSGIGSILYGTPNFYLASFLALAVSLSRDIVYKYLNRTYRPTWYHIVQEIDSFKKGEEGSEMLDQVDVQVQDTQQRITLQRTPTAHTGFAFHEDESAHRFNIFKKKGQTPKTGRADMQRFEVEK